MATYKDRGYGTTIDNYKQQQEKKRKEEEAKKGPVSTQRLTLPKAEAPVSTLRMGTVNNRASSASNLRDKGFSTSIGKQEEFNRSPLLQRAFGTFDNYAKNQVVTGSGYHPLSLTNIGPQEDQLRQYGMALNQVYDSLDKKVQALKIISEPTAADNFGMRSQLKEQGKARLAADIEKQLPGAQKLEQDYKKLGISVAGQIMAQQNEYGKWKESIRDEPEIQAEIAQLKQEKEALYNQKQSIGGGTLAAFGNPQSYRANGAQQLEQAWNNMDEAKRIDQKIDLYDRMIANAEDELAMSKYFKWQSMANDSLPTSQWKAGTPQNALLDRVVRGNATPEEQQQAIQEFNFNANNAALMSENERDTYNKIVQKYGPDAGMQYYYDLENTSLNTRRRADDEKIIRDIMDSSTAGYVGMNALSVLAKPLQVFSHVGQTADMLFGGEMTKDDSYNSFTYLNNAIRNKTSQDISEKLGDTWGKWGAFGYQTAMSMADFLYNGALTGNFGGPLKGTDIAENLSLLLMSSEAAADATMEAKERGLSDGKAYGLGLIAGAAEYVTERVSLETLLDKIPAGKGWKEWVWYGLKNRIAEASEEGASDLINLVADILISKDQSEWEKAVRTYEAQGMDANKAFQQALMDQAESTGMSMLGGWLSGGGMANVMMTANTVSNIAQNVRTLTDTKNVERLVNNGMSFETDTEAYKQAEKLKAKMDAGEKISPFAVNKAYNAISDANLTSQENIKNLVEAGKDSDPKSVAYKSAVNVESKIQSGEEISVREAAQLEKAVRKAISEDITSKNAESIGRRIQNKTEILTQAANEVIEYGTKTQGVKANALLGQIKNGTVDAKTAGEVFLQAEKIYNASQAQVTRTLTPREVTADMDEFDRSAAEIGVSVEDAARTKSVMKALGIEGVYKNISDSRINAYYDKKTGKVVINANAQNPGISVIAHEVTHSLEGTASYSKLADMILKKTKTYSNMADLVAKYKEAGIDLDSEGVRSELVAEYVENKLLTDQNAINDLVKQNRSAAEWIRDKIDSLLAKLGNEQAQERQFLKQAREYYAKALGERDASREAKAKIAEKKGLELPKVEQTEAAQTEAKEITLPKQNDGISYSINTFAKTAGINLSRDSNGKLSFLVDGKQVTEVTAEHIRDKSAFGALITAAYKGIQYGDTKTKGSITKAQAEEQYQAVADLMNTVMQTQDPELTWAIAGSQIFAAVKSNSDGQYGTTVDFTTVCRKTQEMIVAMSERMMAKKGGLSKKEVIALQKELVDAGLSVPCPVCYVFSRWAGVGSLLDNMYTFQNKYENYTPEQIQRRIDELKARNARAERNEIRANLRNKSSEAYDQAYDDLASMRELLKDENKVMKKQLDTAKKNGIQADIDSLSKSLKYNDEMIKGIDKQMKEILDAADTGGKELVWLQKVRQKSTYKAVPAEILFNMADSEAVETFMNEYADSWRYRTTRGPAMGKAINPYSDFRLGDLAMPLGRNSAAMYNKGKTNVFSNPLGIKGQFTKAQNKELVSAIARVRAQNLIGGQRFQSTSDFRYDYALDYIQAFFEAQALGSNIQTYTKIIEFGEMVAKFGGDVNLSVMPKDAGFVKNNGVTNLTNRDGNYTGGYLTYSNVTGINYGAAKILSDRYDSAQLILVGINDDHIRLALNDDVQTGGRSVGFVIPYHASGASIDTFIRELVKNLSEEFKKENYTDYSTVQTDTIKAGATVEQRNRRNLRWQLLTGNARTIIDGKKKTVGWIPTKNDINSMRRFASEKIDISGRSFSELLDIENRALRGDPEAIHEYERWTSDLLYNLYKKLWTKGGSENGVRLNSSQAEAVMPHEYWDKTTTRDTAYLNGFLFRSYCFNLGLHPRFTGIDSKGNMVDFGDFSDCRGYWKTLIDRAMYANDGTYRDQQSVNLSEINVGMIDEETGRAEWGNAMVRKPDVEAAAEIGRGEYQYSINGKTENAVYIKDGTDKNGNTVSFIDLILDGKKLGETRPKKTIPVGEWVGITSGGTNAQVVGRVIFGDPIRITNKSDEYANAYIKGTDYDLKDGESKWYYPVKQVEDFRDNPRRVTKNLPSGARYQYSISTKQDTAYLKAVESGDTETAQRMVDEAAKKAGYTVKAYHGTYNFGRTVFDRYAGMYFTDRPGVARQFSGGVGVRSIGDNLDPNTANIDDLVEYVKSSGPYTDLKRVSKNSEYVKRMTGPHATEYAREYYKNAIKNNERFFVHDDGYSSPFVFSESKIRAMAKEIYEKSPSGGTYSAYLNLGKTVTVNGNGAYYAALPIPKELQKYATTEEIKRGTAGTDQLLRMASDAGYDSVTYKDIVEGGDYGRTGRSTVYAVIAPTSQVKSADPVTYDDSGKPIPLSERFNPENPDIRYSVSRRADQNLRDQVQEIQDQLDMAEMNGLSDTEIRRLNGKLYKAQAQLDQFTVKQRGLAKKTSINDIIANIDRYDRMDLESLAEQISDSAWDDYEDLSDEELRDALVDALNRRADDMAPEDADKARYGFSVKAPKSPISMSYSVSKKGPQGLELPSVEQTEKTEKTKKEVKPVAESKPLDARRWLNRQTIEKFGIPDGKKQIAGKAIQLYADKMLNNGEVTEKDLSDLFYALMDEGVVDVYPDDWSRTLREVVTGGQIHATDSVKADFGDDWNNFRKRAFAAGLLLTNTSPVESSKSQGIDMIYHELSEMAPGVFPADEYDPRQQLETIVKVAEQGKKQQMSLPEYLAYMEKTEGMDMYETAERMMSDLSADLKTFGEMAKLEVKLRDRTGKVITQERERFGQVRDKYFKKADQIRKEEKAKFYERLKTVREQRQLRELQDKTMKQLKWMKKNQFRAPADMKAAWNDLVADMDTYAINVARETQYSKAFDATYGDVKAMVEEAMQNDPNFQPSSEMKKILDRLTSGHIGDMDLDALQGYYDALRALRTEYYQRNNAILGDELAAFSDIYTDAKADMQKQKGKMRGILDLDYMTPMNVLKKMVGWNKNSRWMDMVNDLERGERKVRDFTVRANRLLDDFKNQNKNWLATADGQGKNGQWIEVEVPVFDWKNGEQFATGEMRKVYMTPLQRVQLYLESKGQANMNHIAGGRTFADKELYSQGKRQNAFDKGTTVSLDAAAVKDILKDMTPQEMELAKILENYYNEFSRPYINETSQKLWGYDKSLGGYYAPIITNKNFNHQELGIGDTTARGVDNMKVRQEHAKNASLNISALQAFDRSVSQTARFYGMGTVERNWNMLLNWQSKGDSMRNVISNAWTGKENAVSYIENLIREMQGNTDQVEDTRFDRWINKLLSNYVNKTFGANPGITLKQAASFPTFASVLGWDTMPGPKHIAQVETKAYEDLINTYTSELAYRKMGYASPETAQLTNNPGLLQRNKALNFWLGGGMIIGMDAFTVKAGWAWAENYVDSHFDLNKGTQEQIESGKSPYYKKVAEVFEDAVATTQPMYDIMHRAGIMRKGGVYTRAFTMFRTVPMQMYNSLRRSYGELDFAKQQYEQNKTEANKEAVVSAGKQAATATSAIVISNLALEVIEFLNALWKNRGKKYKDDDDELTFGSAAKEIGLKLIPDSLMVPGLKELSEAIISMKTGQKWYGISLPGGEQLDDLIETIKGSLEDINTFVNGAVDVMKNGEDLELYFKRNGGDYAGALKETIEKLSGYLGGYPLENLEKYIMGAVRFNPDLYQAVQDVFQRPEKSMLKGQPDKAVERGVADIFDNRGVKVSKTVAREVAMLYGINPKAVPTDSPDDLKIDGEEVKLTESQRQRWERKWAETAKVEDLVQSNTFQNADDETKAKMLSTLYDFARDSACRTVPGWTTNYKWPDQIREAVDSGIPLEDAIYAKATGNLSKLLKGETGKLELPSVEPKAETNPYAGQTYTFKGQDVAWEDLSGKQKKIVKAQDAIKEDPNADLSEIIGANNSTKQLANYQAARDAGISNQTYIDALQYVDDANLNENNTYDQEETKNGLEQMVADGKISEKDAHTLWQIITGAKSDKNNPFPVGAIMGLRLPMIP